MQAFSNELAHSVHHLICYPNHHKTHGTYAAIRYTVLPTHAPSCKPLAALPNPDILRHLPILGLIPIPTHLHDPRYTTNRSLLTGHGTNTTARLHHMAPEQSTCLVRMIAVYADRPRLPPAALPIPGAAVAGQAHP